MIAGCLLIVLLLLILIPFLKGSGKTIAMFSSILIASIVTSYYALHVMKFQSLEHILPGSSISGPVPLRLDALSAWFILIINFVFIAGSFYGHYYLKAMNYEGKKLSLHSISLIIMHVVVLSLCVIQNSLVFLIAWEILALSAFLTIILDHEKVTVIRAGINYLVQAHVSIVFLMIGFIYVASKTGSYDFQAITSYTSAHYGASGLLLFFCFFIAFAIKAGFVPFHTWLPYAHPAAPAHVSGLMSGVIIKIGIFGILRMLSLLQLDFTLTGYIILVISVISGLYGVMLAIMQHDLKKLLAYHSVENIGIIGLGIGLGCVGLGSGDMVLATIGFAGALLHTLNHALFKSLLFFAAGNVYTQTHTLDIEKLGGLAKKMPQTTILFLIAAIAICGIPPFNGFISEFIIYTGFYHWLHSALLVALIPIVFSVIGLVLIGGLAIFCFTKAFGIVFLGNPRVELHKEIHEVPFLQRLPLYFIAALIILIGLFPRLFMHILVKPVSTYTGIQQAAYIPFEGNTLQALEPMTLATWLFILLVAAVYGIRRLAVRNKLAVAAPTWGCAYVAPTSRLQYTGSSFARTYSKLFRFVLLSVRRKKTIEGIFPEEVNYESHAYDKIEHWLIDKPIRAYQSGLGFFLFLQNGRLQYYIVYGILFISAVIIIPLFYEGYIALIQFLKQL